VEQKPKKRGQYLQSVTNALRILEELGSQKAVGLSDLARRLDLGKSTCYRLLTTLESRDFVRQHKDTGKYSLGPRTICLAGQFLESNVVYQAAKPVLKELVRRTGEAAHVAVLDRDRALFVAKVDSEHPFRMMSHIGWRAPLHCTALGKVLLAFAKEQALVDSIELVSYTPNTIVNRFKLEMELKRIREQGWAVDEEEAQLGLRCYAAPVRNFEGEVIASISASGPKERVTPHNLQLVVEAARDLSRALGYPCGEK
jgi:IclR family KDG regulon transcriptional repressor